jgi:50S ribosomal subunit-associated GTPase HflX
MDLPDAEENLQALKRRFPSVEVVPLSATTGDGLDELKERLGDWLAKEEAVAVEVGAPEASS